MLVLAGQIVIRCKAAAVHPDGRGSQHLNHSARSDPRSLSTDSRQVRRFRHAEVWRLLG
jgi:hypothetical protein